MECKTYTVKLACKPSGTSSTFTLSFFRRSNDRLEVLGHFRSVDDIVMRFCQAWRTGRRYGEFASMLEIKVWDKESFGWFL